MIDNKIWTTPTGSLGLGVLDARPYATAHPSLESTPITPPAGTGVSVVGGSVCSDATGLDRFAVEDTDGMTAVGSATSRLRGLAAAGSHTTGVAFPADAIQFEKTPSGLQPPRRRLS